MTPPITIALAGTDAEIAACFDVMALLRPHLGREEFVARVRRLEAETGFRLAYLDADGIKCVAGFRVSEWLAGGRYLEIEDLVSAAEARSQGYGGMLFDWLVRRAEAEGCDHLRLVSRVTRTEAHAFYRRKGMEAEAYYFSMRIAHGS